LNNIQYYAENIHYFEYFTRFFEYSLQSIFAERTRDFWRQPSISPINSANLTKIIHAFFIFVQRLEIEYLFKKHLIFLKDGV